LRFVEKVVHSTHVAGELYSSVVQRSSPALRMEKHKLEEVLRRDTHIRCIAGNSTDQAADTDKDSEDIVGKMGESDGVGEDKEDILDIVVVEDVVPEGAVVDFGGVEVEVVDVVVVPAVIVEEAAVVRAAVVVGSLRDRSEAAAAAAAAVVAVVLEPVLHRNTVVVEGVEDCTCFGELEMPNF
jgi:hypothetical protein